MEVVWKFLNGIYSPIHTKIYCFAFPCKMLQFKKCSKIHDCKSWPFWETKIKMHFNPSLNTQSCNRRPLCSTFRFENLSISPKKNCFFNFFKFFQKEKKKIIKAILYNFFWNKTGFSELRLFSNVNALNKGLLLQDWVFRLGLTLFFSFSDETKTR